MKKAFSVLGILFLSSCASRVESITNQQPNCKNENIHEHTFIVRKTFVVFSHTSKGHNVSAKMWEGKCIYCGSQKVARFGYVHKGKPGHVSFETCENYCPKIADTIIYNYFNHTEKFIYE